GLISAGFDTDRRAAGEHHVRTRDRTDAATGCGAGPQCVAVRGVVDDVSIRGVEGVGAGRPYVRHLRNVERRLRRAGGADDFDVIEVELPDCNGGHVPVHDEVRVVEP